MNPVPEIPAALPASMRSVNLERSLLLRISLFAVALLVAATAVSLAQARTRIRADIQATGDTMRQLIIDEVDRSTTAFNRNLGEVDLSTLRAIGQFVHVCAEFADLDAKRIAQRCLGDTPESARPWRELVRWVVGSGAQYHATIVRYPGIKVGELTITPNFDREGADFARQLRDLLGITAGVLLLNVLVYVPVRRALQPTQQILDSLGRMESGDLSVRLPAFPLIELHKIGTVFNLLAERLQHTLSEQRQLAERLLVVREDERRHLARELHDELGQCLSSIQAEAAYAKELASDKLPELTPCAQAIARTSAHMLEVLQQMLRQLRPIGLEEFGLIASLEQLVSGWNRRSDGACRYRLEVSGEFGDLSDALSVNLYRIVQESLTNASRHGKARTVIVAIARVEGVLSLSVEDDGTAAAATAKVPGLGLLGMRERVLALGGQLTLTRRDPHGMRVSATLPAAPLHAELTT